MATVEHFWLKLQKGQQNFCYVESKKKSQMIKGGKKKHKRQTIILPWEIKVIWAQYQMYFDKDMTLCILEASQRSKESSGEQQIERSLHIYIYKCSTHLEVIFMVWSFWYKSLWTYELRALIISILLCSKGLCAQVLWFTCLRLLCFK